MFVGTIGFWHWPESVATLAPFGPIEGQKWFDRISSQWESQKNRFALNYFGKIRFLPPCIWNILRRWTWTGDFKCREVKTGFCRNRSMQTGSSGLSLAGNMVKPLLSLYGTEWRERGYGHRSCRTASGRRFSHHLTLSCCIVANVYRNSWKVMFY